MQKEEEKDGSAQKGDQKEEEEANERGEGSSQEASTRVRKTGRRAERRVENESVGIELVANRWCDSKPRRAQDRER